MIELGIEIYEENSRVFIRINKLLLQIFLTHRRIFGCLLLLKLKLITKFLFFTAIMGRDRQT